MTLSSPDEFSAHPWTAINSRGDAIVAWRRYTNGDRRAGIEASLRPAGGSFGPAQQVIPPGGVDFGDVGIDEGGDAQLVWQTGSEICGRAPPGASSGARSARFRTERRG